MRRYWFEFEQPAQGPRIGFGVGITAHDLDDAMGLLNEVAFPGQDVPPVSRVQEDIDIRTLDANHVRGNMGDCSVRGVWWPPTPMPPRR